LDRKYVQEHLKVVDEIITVLKRALLKLVEDVKQLKLVDQKVHIACEYENLAIIVSLPMKMLRTFVGFHV